MPEDYDDIISPEERPQGAISKTVASGVGTLAIFMGLHVAGMWAFKGAKGRAFKALSSSSNPQIKAAAQKAANSGSLTDFIANVTEKGGAMSRFAADIYQASVSSSAAAIRSGWKTQGLNQLEKIQAFNKLSTLKQGDLVTNSIAKYTREAAATFPLFYVGEHNIGMLQEGPEKKEKPSWYNLPGHAMEFAKFVPTMVAGDLGFRGLGKLGGMALASASKVTKPLEEAIASSPISDAAVDAANWFAKGKYREFQISGMKLGDIVDQVGASKDAYIQSLQSENRKKWWLRDKSVFSGYKRTRHTMYDIYNHHRQFIRSKTDELYKRRVLDYEARLKKHDTTTEEGLRFNLRDFIKHVDEKNEVRGVTDYEELLNSNADAAAVDHLVGQSFYKENSKSPFLARLLGLRRATGADFEEKEKVLGGLYDKLLKTSALKGKDKVLGKSKEDFVNKVLSNNTFIHKRTGQAVNLDYLSPRHWAEKALYATPSIMGFSPADLYPFKVFARKPMDRVLIARDQVALPQSQQLEAFQNKLLKKSVADTSNVTYKNVYDISSTATDGRVAVLTRKAGDSLHSMYDFDNTVAGGWVQVGRNIKAALRSDSPKGHRVYYEQLVSATDTSLKSQAKFSKNPFIRFAQEHLSLMDNKGATPSIFRRIQMNLPEPMQRFFNVDKNLINSRTSKMLKDIKRLSKHETEDIVKSPTQQHVMMGVLNRFKSLSAKVRKRSFDATLSDEYYFDEVVGFLRNEMNDDFLRTKKIQTTEDIFDLALHIRSSKNFNGSNLTHRELKHVDSLLSEARLSKEVLRREIHPELPVEKLKRFIFNYAVDMQHTNQIKDSSGLTARLLQKATKAYQEDRLSKSQLSDLEFSLFTEGFEREVKKLGFSKEKRIENISEDDIGSLLRSLRGGLTEQKSILGGGNVLDNFTFQTGYFDTIWNQSVESGIEDVMATLNTTMESNPWVAYPSNFKDWMGLSGGWVTSTVSKLVSSFGLGWDKGRFSTAGEVTGLQARRLGTFGAALLGYNAVDTITDASGLFDGTFLDEGLTVGIADQAVRMRLIGAKVYDMLGVDNAARYMEGLMPGSANVLPGAAVGYLVGGMAGAGVKGAAMGALANAYLGPQLQEGPLSFLGLLPPLAPFVTDVTKSFEEVQDIYEGKELLARRKGAGWTIGQTPIEGGKIEGWELHWYPKLKSQYKSSPVLYGSAVEEFLAKDLPLVDFSLMDLVDPQYLTYKHYKDRPYIVPDAPFSEVPVIGPILGSTLGRAYNLVHPLGQVDPMHTAEASAEYMKGMKSDWKGNPLGTYGPQYGGVNTLGVSAPSHPVPGQTPNENRVMSPYDLKPTISEQIYKGWIEWMGLPGFLTSAALWEGDEPFTNIPLLASASEMDSFARTYWDMNVGDMALSNELFRRFVPRPRTSYETVDLIRNAMPSWIPEHLKSGDPYCLLPNTLVETSEGLKEAHTITRGNLVKTMYGRFYPVSNIVTRPVDEDIYCIKITGLEDFPIKVTGAHPFYVREDDEYKWVLAKDLTKNMHVTYPMLSIELDSVITDKGNFTYNDCRLAKLLGLLSRWTERGSTKLRKETPSKVKQDIEFYLNDLDIEVEDITNVIEDNQTNGIPVSMTTSRLTVVLSYLEAFRVSSSSELKYRFHTKEAAYRAWTALIQNEIFAFINEDTLTITDRFGAELSYLLDLNHNYNSYETPYCRFDHNSKIGTVAFLSINTISTEKYTGDVYTVEVEGDETYCVPGAIVHNSKIAHGELYLPGAGYEAAFNPDITFPVGMSRLGKSSYDQALGMLGLSDITEDQEEILEKGSAIHKMVQNQLMQSGLATHIEALVTDPEHNLRSYVDVMLKDQRGNQLPLEVKSISPQGFGKLSQPKYEHRVQLNSYMALMGANRGKFLYVQRDDPSQTKEFTIRFNPDMWQQTLNRLSEARSMAQEFLSQGYGTAHEGYSYLDRMRVLLNAAPYSKEFRETNRLLEEQMTSGYLSEEEQANFSQLKAYHTAMMRKYEMYPRRFRIDQLLDPDSEYDNLSSNENIRPADNYSLAERIVGSTWEYATHLRSPIHSKLIGRYSPEEQYERFVLYGVPFQSWSKPYDTFLKPYATGMRAVDDPMQGAASFGVGGLLLGGMPGALAGGAIGAAYGTMHGLYRALTGDKYIPDSFKEKQELKEYFDTIEYMRAEQMYLATGDPQYRKQIAATSRGWIESGGGQFWNIPESSGTSYNYNPGNMNDARRAAYNPYSQYGHTNRGHNSPWGGQDMERDLRYDTNINIYSAFSALPAWDRPFWTAFLDSPESSRERIEQMVDSRTADMLKVAWGRGEEVNLPDMDTFFSTYNKPSTLSPIMGPDFNPDDYLTVTAEERGIDAHDYGLGWRDQLRRIQASPVSILPIDINGQEEPLFTSNNVGPGDLESAVNKILTRMGYEGAQVMVHSSPSETNETILRVNVKRDSSMSVIKELYG